MKNKPFKKQLKVTLDTALNLLYEVHTLKKQLEENEESELIAVFESLQPDSQKEVLLYGKFLHSREKEEVK